MGGTAQVEIRTAVETLPYFVAKPRQPRLPFPLLLLQQAEGRANEFACRLEPTGAYVLLDEVFEVRSQGHIQGHGSTIQGEFYRRLRTPGNGFAVNCRYWDDVRVEHDLYAARPAEMVAELKVYGMRGYYPKNLYGGSDLSRFLPPAGERVHLTAAEIAGLVTAGGSAGKNSYLRDAQRLLDVPATVERYLILVLQKAATADAFGRAIAAVRVAPHEFDLELEAFHVRVSQWWAMTGCDTAAAPA